MQDNMGSLTTYIILPAFFLLLYVFYIIKMNNKNKYNFGFDLKLRHSCTSFKFTCCYTYLYFSKTKLLVMFTR